MCVVLLTEPFELLIADRGFQESSLAQMTAMNQQRELTRYARSMGEWLEHDVQERQTDVRELSARVDRLRDDLGLSGSPASGFFERPRSKCHSLDMRLNSSSMLTPSSQSSDLDSSTATHKSMIGSP